VCNDDLTSWHRSAFKVDELLTSSKLKTGLYMDTIEAKKNLDLLYKDRFNLENLNHLNAREQFKQDCKRRIRDIDTQIANIKQNLKGQ